MPLYMNGTLIPENVANALYFNGTNITDVYMNGVQVWNQSLCTLCNGWSGVSEPNGIGINTSGLSWRWRGVSNYGSWLYATSAGSIGSGSSEVNNQGINSVSGGTFRYRDSVVNFGSDYITFNSGTKSFSGSSVITGLGTYGFQTSSGLIRFMAAATGGAWISLT